MKKNYTILSLLMVLFTLTMNAQVVYVDIPDGQPAGLDFNQDGTKEFDISSQNKLGDYIEYIAYGMGNNIHAVGDQTNAWDVPALQAQGFTVDASNNWAGMGDAYPNGDYANPPGNSTIIPGTDQYMAVRFNLAPNLAAGDPVYYGWVRVNIDASGNVTYKDYAYNATAGTPIDTGEMPGNAINDSNILEITIYPNPVNNQLHINTDNKITAVSIWNLDGKEVYSQENPSNTVNISFIPAGVYFVKVKMADKISVKKIIKL